MAHTPTSRVKRLIHFDWMIDTAAGQAVSGLNYAGYFFYLLLFVLSISNKNGDKIYDNLSPQENYPFFINYARAAFTPDSFLFLFQSCAVTTKYATT